MLTKDERTFILTLFSSWRENKVSAKTIADTFKIDHSEVELFLIEVDKVACR